MESSWTCNSTEDPFISNFLVLMQLWQRVSSASYGTTSSRKEVKETFIPLNWAFIGAASATKMLDRIGL